MTCPRQPVSGGARVGPHGSGLGSSEEPGRRLAVTRRGRTAASERGLCEAAGLAVLRGDGQSRGHRDYTDCS